MTYYTLIAFITIIFLAREITTYKTIKSKDDLIDRMSNKLMAKDFKEYHEATTPTPVYAPVSGDDEELYNREIESVKV